MTEEQTIRADSKKPILLRSPVEFALVGPSDGRDRILLQSVKAGLDLIGLAAEGVRSKEYASSDTLSLIFGGAQQINIVFSFPTGDTNPKKDKRRSKLSFVWKGFTSSSGIERVEQTLNLQLPHLDEAIRKRDKSEIEWALAPVIYQCAQANERRLRLRRALLATIAVYISIGILAAIFSAWFSIQRFIESMLFKLG